MDEACSSINAAIPADLPEELETLLASGRSFRLQRIVSRGHATPPGQWYDQAEAEWVILLGGAARLEFEGDPQLHAMAPGDYVLIPPHRRHRVAWTTADAESIWLALYFEI